MHKKLLRAIAILTKFVVLVWGAWGSKPGCQPFTPIHRPKVAQTGRVPGSIVSYYKSHVRTYTSGARWAKLPYLFPRNTLADGFFQKWKSPYYGGVLGVLKKSD